jgi:Putative prokaryotic signal transducing protein
MANNLVTVATFSNSLEANLAKQLLEAEGIRSYLANESTVDLAWHLTVAVGWIKLQVHESDASQAKFILGSNNLDAETTAPEQVYVQDDDSDDEIIQVSWADQTADRAFRVAVIGLIIIFLPFQLYSLWLLLRLLVSRDACGGLRLRISQNRRWKVIAALLLNLLNLFILWMMFFGK